ncbi:MAG: putative toxin-antitoxin system toxin component, PIN family [Oscillospiraceae bacterium]|nr:putative toxin-antitoxin system toxin component, PIN family [Oscillospiraceae bacterium]
MKILADTNILISALLYPDSKPAIALIQAAVKHELILTDYNISELHRVAAKKFPAKLPDADALLAKLKFELVSAPISAQKLIADPKDAPILNAAILHEVDVIISGDKHFLQLDMEYPKPMKAADFLEIYGSDE